jgi:hypothetical protein
VDLVADLVAHRRVVVMVLVAEESLVDFLPNNAKPRSPNAVDFVSQDWGSLYLCWKLSSSF